MAFLTEPKQGLRGVQTINRNVKPAAISTSGPLNEAGAELAQQMVAFKGIPLAEAQAQIWRAYPGARFGVKPDATLLQLIFAGRTKLASNVKPNVIPGPLGQAVGAITGVGALMNVPGAAKMVTEPAKQILEGMAKVATAVANPASAVIGATLAGVHASGGGLDKVDSVAPAGANASDANAAAIADAKNHKTKASWLATWGPIIGVGAAALAATLFVASRRKSSKSKARKKSKSKGRRITRSRGSGRKRKGKRKRRADIFHPSTGRTTRGSGRSASKRKGGGRARDGEKAKGYALLKGIRANHTMSASTKRKAIKGVRKRYGIRG